MVKTMELCASIDLQREYDHLLKNRRNLVLEWTGLGHRVQL